MRKDLVSTIIRFHREGDLNLLFDAICSVACQSYRHIELILMGQNLSKPQVAEIEEVFEGVLRPVGIKYRLINVKVPKGRDGRTKLLNKGIELARGRYLGFLDYDDIIYPWCYDYLIKKLKTDSNASFAAGICIKVDLDVLGGKFPIIKSKELFLAHKNSFFGFLLDNIFPIHSFLIDLKKAPKKEILIDRRLTALEDYTMILAAANSGKLLFRDRITPICEYRFRNDMTNTTPNFNDPKDKRIVKWKRNAKIVSQLKKQFFLKKTSFFDVEQQVCLLMDVFRKDHNL